ncbi:alpha/beta fold hydrolase [Actinocorallia sp. A-T 12471]|uniref:alpha/beta fold hydrolase n=1 Tax=Actinocorallia sp. A-T 12471 TaxID=3089813 RepID=UPI0029D326BC|nr:alpha/beta fold hydrolase [Actinocorallia sp. A-T 12471]MDX6739785.1 alpha/beta hydrolase [Actinocorallia sp. A-T 12471]
MFPSPKKIRDATANAAHRLRHGALADLTPTPSDPVGPSGALRRYRPAASVIATGPPVLLLPPPVPGASWAFDLRRGGSLAEHLVATGRRVHLLDLAPADTAEPPQGAAVWIGETIPDAVRRVSRDAGGQPVQLVGWSLGGLLAVLAAAADPTLPLASLAVVAAPVDRTAVPAGADPLAHISGKARSFPGMLERIAPEVLVDGYSALGVDKRLTRPVKMLAHLDDADFLAQAEARAAYAARVAADPAAAHAGARFFRRGDLASGALVVGGRRVALSDVRAPVLVLAGRGDEFAPLPAVHPLTRLLTGSAEVRFATAPGSHLGVLTGRAARTTTWLRLGAWLDEATLQHGLRPARKTPEKAVSTP